MVEWYYKYITDRILHFDLQGVQHKVKANMGFPQGGVCSALFWAVAFDGAVEIINKNEINGNAFADDCGAVIGGSHLERMVSKLQKMTDELTDWGQECGLQFNSSQTVVVHFTRRKKIPSKKLKINGQEIEFKNC